MFRVLPFSGRFGPEKGPRARRERTRHEKHVAWRFLIMIIIVITVTPATITVTFLNQYYQYHYYCYS